MSDYCSQILAQEFADRREKNSSYSLRAFARYLSIGSTSLSDVLTNKRQLSKNNKMKVADRLNLSPLQRDLLFTEKGKQALQKACDIKHLEIEEDFFRLIANWYYLAILNLAKLKSSKYNATWVAERLGIDQVEASTALDRLKRLQLIENKKGRLIRTAEPLSTTREIASQAIRKHHLDNLELAKNTLTEVDVKYREFSSVTMAINPKNLKKAKDYLMKAKDRVAEILEQGEPTQVYTLSFQLFPLLKTNQGDKK